jgi:ATP-dependent RNA helicase DDX54/DBP10
MAPKKKNTKSGGFQALGLSKEVFKGVMRLGYKVPTPIQRKCLQPALEGKDIVAMARTGSGKTAAFLIPVIERLKEHSREAGARAIILSPTRELAMQTLNFAKGLAKHTDLRCALIVGGDSMDMQFTALSNNPDMIIATPGRLMHHLMEVDSFNMRKVQIAVFDEADRMFEMGFADQLREILKDMPEQRQILLFSATLPQNLVTFARAGLNNPEVIRLDTDTKISDQLKIAFFTVRSEDKVAALMLVMQHVLPQDQQTLVFVPTKHHVEFVRQLLQIIDVKTSYVYGEMDPEARKINILNFRNKVTQVMVVTDIAARGIDIPLLDNVVNYSFPASPKLFIHRVGRVARAGRSGVAVSLVAPDELAHMTDLDLFLGKGLRSGIEFDKNGGGSNGYSLDEMSVDDVHYGTLPQAALDTELEYLRQLEESGTAQVTDMVEVRRVAGRAMQK